MKVQILVLQFSFKPNFKEMPQLGTYCLSLSSGSVHVSEQESEASDVSGILWILSSAKNSLVYLVCHCVPLAWADGMRLIQKKIVLLGVVSFLGMDQ